MTLLLLTELCLVKGVAYVYQQFHAHMLIRQTEELNCVNAKDSYECMDKRVETVLGALKDDVATHKAECLVTAEELRTEIISDLQ